MDTVRAFSLFATLCTLGALLLTGRAVATRDPEVKTRSGQLQLTLSIAKSQYYGGETVSLAFDLSNVGTERVMMLSLAPGLFGFAAYDAKGNQVVAPLLQKPIMGPPRSPIAPPRGRMLEPGKSISAELTWELATTDSSGRRAPLPAGTYTLIGYAWWDREGAPRLQTPPLSIQILAAALRSTPR